MALGYLLGAAIQFEDKNGKPLVGGTIRVCLHGTSTPYLTYRDFNGNRNPEFVPLNAAGMCVLIADDAGVYDVYCKDQFGVEQWSRLNVTVGGAGGGGGGGSYVAGSGILIVNDTISVDPSVVQGTLTEGTGIVIDGNDTISVDTTVIQEKLTAGSNITIDGSTISATDHDTTYTATAPIAIDSSNDISISLGNGLTTESGSLVIDTSVVQGKLTAGSNIDITEDVVSVSMTASSTSASSYREAVNSVSQSADGSVSASTRKVVGSEWTLCQANSATANKFLKIAEFACYSGFRYVGSGYTNLVVKCSDSDDGRTYTVAVGLMQASNGNHNFSARLRSVVDYCKSSTQPIKSFYLFSDTPYGNNQSQATISLWVEFDSLAYNSWTFEALVNTAVGGTGSDSHENAWEFANGKRYTVNALPTGGWQLNSTEPVSVNVPAVGSGDNGKVLVARYSSGSGTYEWGSLPSDELPPIAGNSGKVLKVNSGATGVEWATDNDTTYSAGTGLTLNGTTFSADTSVLATQNDLNGKQDSLTAGSNITISNNVISATDTTYTFSTGLTESSGTVTVDNPVPTASGSDNGKVLGVTDAQGTIGWVTPTAAQVQSDWTEANTADPSYIQNKPAEKALAAGTGISISEGTTAITISATAQPIDILTHSESVTIQGGQFVNPETYSLNKYIAVGQKFYGTLSIQMLYSTSNVTYIFELGTNSNTLTCNFGDYASSRQSGHVIPIYVDNTNGSAPVQLFFTLAGQFEAQTLAVKVQGITIG